MLDAKVWVGHSADHLDDVDSVVYSTAIPPKHLELVAGRERGLRVLRRAAALAAALGDRRALTVAGTHGKTTTTSLLTVALQAGGLDPSFAIGGTLHETGRNAHFGSGEYAVIEADESDGSFLLLRSEIAIVTNVEADHLENHGDLAGVERAFEQFVDRIVARRAAGGLRWTTPAAPGWPTTPGGVMADGRDLRVVTYGESADADVVITQIVEAADSVTLTVARHRCRWHRADGDRGRAGRAAHGPERGRRAGRGRPSSASTSTGWPQRGTRSAASSAASSCAAPPTACGCTTTTPTTRPRSRPRCMRPAPRAGPAGWSRSSSRARSAARRPSPPSSPRPWPWPTSPWSWTSSRPARSRSPA